MCPCFQRHGPAVHTRMWQWNLTDQSKQKAMFPYQVVKHTDCKLESNPSIPHFFLQIVWRKKEVESKGTFALFKF